MPNLLMATGIVLAVILLATAFYAWQRLTTPADAVVRRLEEHFKSEGEILAVYRVPLVRPAARDGSHLYRVEILTALGSTVTHTVRASPQFVGTP